MERCRTQGNLPLTDRPVALTIGNFDGIHLGHRAVLASAVSSAESFRGDAWVLTFDPHPARFFRPDRAPPILTSDAQRERIFSMLGLHGWWILPFDSVLAALAPGQFAEKLRTALPNLKSVRVGANWRFGHKAAGDAGLLGTIFSSSGIEVVALPPVLHDGIPVSSTRIRDALLRANIQAANQLLGRPYEVEGTVVAGRGFARTLGFPSANLRADHDPMLPPGIYACACEIDGKRWRGAGYVPGDRSTFEVHLAGYQGDLYGRTLVVHVLTRLREDRLIADIDELKAQIAEDVRAVLAMPWT
jgi:riboflavin kinase/FMN adenylyltransferase